MLKKLIVILIFPFLVFSQKFTLSGAVKDSLNIPLEFVNIVAEQQGKLKSFSFTDEKGNYQLVFKDSLPHLITITHIGFQPIKFSYKPNKNANKNIILKEQSNLLEEVVIESPVVVKEDTIFYNTEKFVNGRERKLKNIIKKLPGLDVDRYGKVTFNGKKVKKVYVDGKPFFNGSTKLAVENIPADAVKDIKILDNHNDVSFLKKYNESGEMIMDVTLKNDKKKFIFGDIEAGKGNRDFYKVHSNLFYHSPKTSVNSIFKINNIGEKTFTINDYVGFHADKNSVFKGEFDFNMTGFKEFIENSDLLKTTRRFGAGNITTTINPKLYFSSFVIYSGNTSETFSKSENQYPNFSEVKEEANGDEKKMLLGDVYFKYTMSDSELFKFKTKFNWLDKNNVSNINFLIDKNQNFINSNVIDKNKYINQQIEWHKEYSEKTTFSALADYKFDQIINPNYYNGTSSFFNGLIPVNSTNNLTTIYHEDFTKKNYFNTTFKSFSVIKPRHQLHTTFGNLYREEVFKTNAYQELKLLINDFDNKFDNNLKFTFHSLYASLHHRFKRKKIRLKYGFYLKRNHWNINQNGSTDNTTFNILPNIDFKIKFHSAKEFSLGYGLINDFTEVENLTKNLNLSNYNSVFRGNPLVGNTLYHSAKLNYMRHNIFKRYWFFARASYRKMIRGYVSTIQFDGYNRIISFEELDNPSEHFSMNFDYSKRIQKIKIGLFSEYSKSKNQQYINDTFTATNNDAFNYRFTVKTLFKKLPVVSMSYGSSFSFYNILGETSKFVTNTFHTGVEYDFLEAFTAELDYNFNKTKNFSTNNYQLFNASFTYHDPDSDWTFKLYGNNLLNFEYKQNSSFSNYLISDRKQYLMPRMVMFSLAYKI